MLCVKALQNEIHRLDARRPGKNRLVDQKNVNTTGDGAPLTDPQNQCSVLFLSLIPARPPDSVKQDAAPSLTLHKIQSLRMAGDEAPP